MGKQDELLKALLQEEEELVFESLTNEDALDLGLTLVNLAKREHVSISIDVTRNGHQLFHHALTGTAPNNARWMAGKMKVVNHYCHSSYYVQMDLLNCGKSIEEEQHLSSFEYLPFGGAFPIRIKNAGVIGTVAVSGLPPADDHALVARGVREYLASKK